MHFDISNREQHLLRMLVEKYIEDGQPVSSKSISESQILPFSPATIRNIMAELEEKGYIRSLHTSSGRVPTSHGYRFFIDSLLTVRALEETIIEEVKQELHPAKTTSELMTSTSNLLSKLTGMAGLVMVPSLPKSILRHVEFLPLSQKRILIILVLNEKDVQNRIIQIDTELSRSELENAANYLNQTFSGYDIEKIAEQIQQTLQEDNFHFKNVLNTFLTIATDTMQVNDNKKDFILAGEHQLLTNHALTNLDQLKNLFEAINQKRQVLHLLNQCLSAQSMKIFIGEESGYTPFEQFSMISAPYSVQGRIMGALGIIGPSRMPYEWVIPIVDISAKILSAALESELD